MGNQKKLALFILLNIVLFTAFGMALFDKRGFREDQLDDFLASMGSEKSLNFFPQIGKTLKGYGCLEISVAGTYQRSLFYKMSEGKATKTDLCKADIKIILNDHSIGSIIYGSYNALGVILSEILSGNLQIEGLKLGALF